MSKLNSSKDKVGKAMCFFFLVYFFHRAQGGGGGGEAIAKPQIKFVGKDLNVCLQIVTVCIQ